MNPLCLAFQSSVPDCQKFAVSCLSSVLTGGLCTDPNWISSIGHSSEAGVDVLGAMPEGDMDVSDSIHTMAYRTLLTP